MYYRIDKAGYKLLYDVIFIIFKKWKLELRFSDLALLTFWAG